MLTCKNCNQSLMWGHVHPLVVVLVHNADQVAVPDVVLVVIDIVAVAKVGW